MIFSVHIAIRGVLVMWFKKKQEKELDINIREKILKIKELELHIGFLNLEIASRKNNIKDIDYLYDSSVK